MAHAAVGLPAQPRGPFVLARLAYTGAYAADLPSLRSSIWTLGFLCVLGLFVVAAIGGPAAAPAG